MKLSRKISDLEMTTDVAVASAAQHYERELTAKARAEAVDLRRILPYGVSVYLRNDDPEKMRGWPELVVRANMRKFEIPVSASRGPQPSVWAPNEDTARLLLLYRLLRRSHTRQRSLAGMTIPKRSRKYIRDIGFEVGSGPTAHYNVAAWVHAQQLANWAAANFAVLEADPVPSVRFQRPTIPFSRLSRQERKLTQYTQRWSNLRRKGRDRGRRRQQEDDLSPSEKFILNG
jgi:hypothetical protein